MRLKRTPLLKALFESLAAAHYHLVPHYHPAVHCHPTVAVAPAAAMVVVAFHPLVVAVVAESVRRLVAWVAHPGSDQVAVGQRRCQSPQGQTRPRRHYHLARMC